MNQNNFLPLAGTYVLHSPYHKSKKLLPFNVETDGYVSTVEYKGYTPYFYTSFYTVEQIQSLIDSKVIFEGKANFPRSMRKQID